MKNSKALTILFLISILSVNCLARSKHNKIIDAVVDKIEEKAVEAPRENEVCFSPVDRCDVKLAKFIEGAKKSLDIAIFDINEDQIVHQILVQSKKIPVRVIVDKRQSKGDHSSVGLLKKAGVNVRYGKQRSLMHSKFTIRDQSMIETGSFNYTFNATKNNNENQVYLATPEIVLRYKERFEEMWQEAR